MPWDLITEIAIALNPFNFWSLICIEIQIISKKQLYNDQFNFFL